MPVTGFAEGDLFVIRVTKFLGTNPDRKWVNNYEFRAKAAGDEGDLLTCATAIVNWELQFHLVGVVFDRVLISTWEPDSVPYNPQNFIASSLTASGIRPLGSSQAEPLNLCLDVRKQCSFGRFGHLFYRGALLESDVYAPAGKSTLTDRAGLDSEVQADLNAANFDPYVTGGDGPLELVMVGKTAADVRVVDTLRVSGVAVVPWNHAWFNRTSPTP